MGGPWPTEHDAELAELLKAGDLSYSRIAGALNEKFRTQYSRNATIGRAGRMGLAATRALAGRVPRKPAPKRESTARITVKPARPAPSSPEAVALRCVEVNPRLIPLNDLTEATCKWPYGDASPFSFCGHPVFEGCYCGPHFYLSTRN